MDASPWTPAHGNGPDLDAASKGGYVRNPAQAWLIEALPTPLHLSVQSPMSRAIATAVYAILTVAFVALTRWLAGDLVWVLADLGMRRWLGPATIAGTLVLAAAAGASLALPLRPFLPPKRWRLSVGALSCSVWLTCGVWLLLDP